MLQKTDKKKYILFYLITFLILSSIHNSNFKSNNFFFIKKIDVVGLNKSNNILLENKLVDLIGDNIFTLEKKSKNNIQFLCGKNLYKRLKFKKTPEFINIVERTDLPKDYGELLEKKYNEKKPKN